MNPLNCHFTEAGRLPAASAGQGLSPSGMATQDWDLLFSAVSQRLGQCANHLLAAGSPQQQASAAISVSNDVLDCVADLTRLHTALRQQRSSIIE